MMRKLLSIILLVLICFSSNARKYREYETIELNDGNNVLVYTGHALSHHNVTDTISIVDNSNEIRKGLDSVYIIKYVYKTKEGVCDSINTYIKNFKELVENIASSVDINSLTYVIIDSMDRQSDGFAFIYAPSIYNSVVSKFSHTIPCDGLRKSAEHAIINMKLKPTPNTIIMEMVVYGIKTSYSGGITDNGTSDFLPVSKLFSNDSIIRRDDVAKSKKLIDHYANRTAIDIFKMLNGGNVTIFRNCARIKSQDNSEHIRTLSSLKD